MLLRSGDADIFYDVRGRGPAVVLLHAFPLNHQMWLPVANFLEGRYRCILPDLRAHGRSGPGEGAASMQRHAGDILRLLDELHVSRAFFGGVSIGGYIAFEIWRQARDRVAGFVLCNTKAQADTPAARAARHQAIEYISEHGPEPFVESMLLKLLGATTISTRPDIEDRARALMMQSTAAGLQAALAGLAERPDSVSTLPLIDMPVLVIGGEEDTVTPVADAEILRTNIPGARLAVVPKAGHLAVFERPEECGTLIRNFLDEHRSLLQS